MKANELRIGNFLFHDKNGFISVLGTSSHCGDFKLDTLNAWVYLKNCAPIPLTEQWLLDFGFEKYDNVVVNQFEYFERFVLKNVIEGTSNFEVHIIHSNYDPKSQSEDFVEIIFSIDIDERQRTKETGFVHNLQNSFFIVTGEELTKQ